ncbi:MAG: hypothetical protein IJX14_10605 [Clostridia bacterium]|nr:hypothetical protein [Clostridia bacterium]
MRYDCTVDLLPDACPLSVLERYLPDADRERFLSYYRCLDGTPAVLEEYAARTYVTVIQENGLDVAASETEIREAFVRYCRDNGIAYDPDRPDTLGQLAEHLRSQILVQSPAALAFPMAFLDPAIPEEEQAALVELLHAEGLFSGKLLTGMEPDATGRYALDLSDLELFGNLRTVILNDRLVMEDKTALTEGWCAVIER